jgi:anaerobic magnesium-protoporphyrin IX monomethyl ester cyclase
MPKINKPKVLLIIPNILPFEFTFQVIMRMKIFPLGLSYIASFIKENQYPVKILDAFSENLSFKEILAIIKEYGPSVVGIGSVVHNEFGIEIIKLCKRFDPRIVTVLGGLAPTFMPLQIMEHISELDFIIRGEGEIPFLYLLEALEGRRSFSSIKGLVYRKSAGEIVCNEGRYRLENLDTLPFAAKNIFITRNKRPYFYENKYITMETSRGCLYSCKFCVVSEHFGKEVRYRDVKLVADEMQDAIKLFNTKLFGFCDNTFTANRKYANALLNEIMSRGIYKQARFRIMTRIDCIDEQLLKRLKQANCCLIGYGIESPSQETVDAYDKKINLKQVQEVFDLTKKAGIQRRALLIFNQYEFPDKKIANNKINEVIDFIKRIKPESLTFSPIVIYPNHPMYNEILANKAISSDGYKEIFKRNYIPSLYLSRDEIESLVIKVYSAIYFGRCIKTMIYKSFKPIFRNLNLFR